LPRIAVVTDSVADLPPELAADLGITVVPLTVRFGTEVHRDGIDITPDQFFEKLKTSDVFPLTSAPPPAAFAETYDRLAENRDGIVAVSVSSRFSATYQSAVAGISLMKNPCPVEVLDSEWAVMAQGFVAVAAARSARTGAGLDEVLSAARRAIDRVGMRGAFDTLKYLERGGRIGKAQALLGSLLKLNPVIGIKNGQVYPFARPRSRAKALDYLFNFALSFRNVEALAVEYATDLAEADRLVGRLRGQFPGVPIYLSRVSPVIGAHTGPGLILVSVMGER